MPLNQSGSFKSSEIEYKINLSKQIDRIADLFSQKIDERHEDIAATQKIIIDTQLTAVNFLGYMIQPYQDDKYDEALTALEKEFGINGDSDVKLEIRLKQSFAERKFGLLMNLMHRKRMLMEESVEEVEEGFEEVGENVIEG